MTPVAWLCIASACAGATLMMLPVLVLGFCVANAWAEIEDLEREVELWQRDALDGVRDDTTTETNAQG